ncbi:hypothetical protein MML48_5g00021099 [Holotrichia oblita]|uniref:Uncharacterized protein n=1 Tax=Holotrichia oblita TaxID=644536 RepID=A0ACB9T2A8_HOLOL|nr:hypothetical protein MML48_5g00021099 [Holotrichia oblita]
MSAIKEGSEFKAVDSHHQLFSAFKIKIPEHSNTELPEKPIYIAPFEVVIHNKPDDCWVSFLGKVFNVTPLIDEYKNQDCIRPLLAFAGKDISHWFDAKTGDIQHHVHPITGARVPYCPHGRIPHVEIQVPSTKWRPLSQKPWWFDDKRYMVGLLTKRVRPVRIVNTLICKEVHLDVCCEDTITRIMERYSIFNSDSNSYTWRCNDKNLKMDKTLEENDILDERDEFTRLGLPPNLYVPAIFLYYNDDFIYEEE